MTSPDYPSAWTMNLFVKYSTVIYRHKEHVFQYEHLKELASRTIKKMIMVSRFFLIKLTILLVLVPGISNGQEITVTTNKVDAFKEGDKAKLRCSFTPAEALVDVTWFRRPSSGGDETIVTRNVVLEEYKDRFSLDQASGNQRNGNGDLVINPVKKEDKGNYFCRVYSTSNPGKFGDGFPVLDVQWHSLPRLSLIPDEKREYGFEIGDNATFICSDDGNPTPEIIWYKNNVTIENSADMDRYDVNGTLGQLKISNLTLDDHAVFNCSTTNNINTLFSNSISLNVKHTPIVELQSDNVSRVFCIASAYPLPSSYIFKVDEKSQTGQGNTLTLKIDDPSGCANVSCKVQNLDGFGLDEKEICIIGKPTPEPVQKLEGGVIAGIAIGCVVGLCLIIFALIYVLKKGKPPAKAKETSTPKKTGGNAIYKPVAKVEKADDAIDTVEIKTEGSPKTTENKPWV